MGAADKDRADLFPIISATIISATVIASVVVAAVIIATIVTHVFAFVVRRVFHAVLIVRCDFFIGVFLGRNFLFFGLTHVERLVLRVTLFAINFLVGD